jgi:hypothetical protein
MKKQIIFAVLVFALIALTGCATQDAEEGTVCFTEEELEELYVGLEEVEVEEGGEIQYAPSQSEKSIIFERLRNVMVSRMGESSVSCRDVDCGDDWCLNGECQD